MENQNQPQSMGKKKEQTTIYFPEDYIPYEPIIGRKYHLSWAKKKGMVWTLTYFESENDHAVLKTKFGKTITTQLSALRVLNKYLDQNIKLKKQMRYALRNQDKIKEKLGDELLQRMIKSLNQAFRHNPRINEKFEVVPGERFPILAVDDAGHTVNIIAFYVIEKNFNVYTLAFKEFIG